MAVQMALASVRILREKPSACLIDAANGLAFPACSMAVDEAITRARSTGIGLAAVTNSHHFGVAAYHVSKVAEHGMIGLAFGNSPAAMPAWGGKRALFGTNPIAAIFPRKSAAPLCIDLSLSEVARGKVMIAAQQGKPIPFGWALDRDGQPTTDARAALDGVMLPAGGVKGAMLALIVELLCVALTGCKFRIRSRFVLRRRRQSAATGAGISGDRSCSAGGRRRLSLTSRNADRGDVRGSRSAIAG